MRTIEPINRPSFEQWVKELRVSSKYIANHLKELVTLDDRINYNRYLKGIKNNEHLKKHGQN